jgi:DNA-binding transcriptional regulator YhcF (GntR family)
LEVLSFTEQYTENGNSKISAGYFQVPECVFDLSLPANEKLLLIYFLRRANREGRSFPSVGRICRDCGIKSRTTVSKAIKGLEKAGFVRKSEVAGRPHFYIVSKEFYEVIRAAKEKHSGNRNESECAGKAEEVINTASQLEYMLTQISSPAPSEYDP